MLNRIIDSLRNRLLLVLFRTLDGISSVTADIYLKVQQKKLSRAIQEYNNQGGTKAGFQYPRAISIGNLLRKYKPQHVLECGSGFSTCVFSYYSAINGFLFISFEENETWENATSKALSTVDLNANIVLSTTEIDDKGVRYTTDLPDADFVYIDGPYNNYNNVKHPNTDILGMFDRGHFPETIVIDGRFPTIKVIQNSPSSSRYKMYPSMKYAYECRSLTGILSMRRHTVFRRTANDIN